MTDLWTYETEARAAGFPLSAAWMRPVRAR